MADSSAIRPLLEVKGVAKAFGPRLLFRRVDAALMPGTLSLLAGAGAPVLKASLSLRDEIQFDSALCERNHLMRMREKRCASDSGILYIELLGEIRKVSRHLANIAQRS